MLRALMDASYITEGDVLVECLDKSKIYNFEYEGEFGKYNHTDIEFLYLVDMAKDEVSYLDIWKEISFDDYDNGNDFDYDEYDEAKKELFRSFLTGKYKPSGKITSTYKLK